MRRHRGDTPYALDLRIIEVEAPRLSYGINRLRAHDGHFFPNGAGKNSAQPGQGYAPECVHRGLVISSRLLRTPAGSRSR